MLVFRKGRADQEELCIAAMDAMGGGIRLAQTSAASSVIPGCAATAAQTGNDELVTQGWSSRARHCRA
jgi:hypothetical protein